MKREPSLYLDDILASIEKIGRYIKGLSFDEFVHDEKTVDSVIRNLEIIGEAARSMPESFKSEHRNIPWDAMIGMRNKVAHEYFGVDYEIVWETITHDLPVVGGLIKKL